MRSSSRCCSWCRSPRRSSGACGACRSRSQARSSSGSSKGCRRSTRTTGSPTRRRRSPTRSRPASSPASRSSSCSASCWRTRACGREQFEVDLRAGPAETEIAPAQRLTGWRAAIGPLAVALVLFSVPLWLNDFWVGVLSQGVALAVLFLTFTVVIGEGGMLSLAQVALAGIGAFTAAKLATDAGWPVWLALLAGALVTVPIGLLVAALSLRLGDLYLALGHPRVRAARDLPRVPAAGLRQLRERRGDRADRSSSGSTSTTGSTSTSCSPWCSASPRSSS